MRHHLLVSSVAAVFLLAIAAPVARADGTPNISADVSSSSVLYGTSRTSR